jgi:hypothetical protein
VTATVDVIVPDEQYDRHAGERRSIGVAAVFSLASTTIAASAMTGTDAGGASTTAKPIVFTRTRRRPAIVMLACRRYATIEHTREV